MKEYKPYLFLEKINNVYELNFVLRCSKQQTIESIEQEEIEIEGKKYWGVTVTLSTNTQLVNGPESPIFSSVVEIPQDADLECNTIKCIVVQSGGSGNPASESSDIDFGDA